MTKHGTCAFTGDVVHVQVTEESRIKLFYIAKKQLYDLAPAFANVVAARNCLGLTLELNNIKIAAFQQFLRWLDFEEAPESAMPPFDLEDLGFNDVKQKDVLAMTQLYVFGMQHELVSLQQHALKQLVIYLEQVAAEENDKLMMSDEESDEASEAEMETGEDMEPGENMKVGENLETGEEILAGEGTWIAEYKVYGGVTLTGVKHWFDDGHTLEDVFLKQEIAYICRYTVKIQVGELYDFFVDYVCALLACGYFEDEEIVAAYPKSFVKNVRARQEQNKDTVADIAILNLNDWRDVYDESSDWSSNESSEESSDESADEAPTESSDESSDSE